MRPAAVTVLGLLALLGSAAVPAAELLGKAAPDFALHSLDGNNRRLSELRGEVVLINFWATWCGPCRQEMPVLEQIHRQYRELGFQVLGVNVDDRQQPAADMARSLGLSFPVLFDEAKTVSRLYGVDTMPMSLLIGRDGTVRYRHQGYQRGTEQAYLDQLRVLLKE